MATPIKALMAILIAGCCLTALFTFSQTHSLEAASIPQSRLQKVDGRLAAKLQAFPGAVQILERRLLDLERSIQEITDGTAAAASGVAEAAQVPAAPVASVRSLSHGVEVPNVSPFLPGQRFRQDKQCGKNPSQRLPDGGPAECDSSSDLPCCSPLGWCGNSPDHCTCKGCVDYSKVHVLAPSPTPAGAPASGGSTVVVIIPFRDREGHLVKFKQYWRWFAKEGWTPRKVTRWEVFIVEQFDSETFNRGWNFNVGLAIVSGLTSASPDITRDMRIMFDCAVIQDVDYLPEKGVDYADCAFPTQLSAEIDRYDWKTPYLESAGGIVGMSLQHWRQINGFGNDYFGWGGEDDELHHRLRLNNLLHGDCHPFCKSDDDPDRRKKGLSIKRPPKGHGRFSGKFMHSANHTKRITDSAAYARNIKMLQEIQAGSSRWKTDGLSSLAFRVLDIQVDRADTADGLTYHHVKVRRGREPYDLRSIGLAVPRALCEEGASHASTGAHGQTSWLLSTLGAHIPWDIAALRSRTAALVQSMGGACAGFVKDSLSFILIDRGMHLAKVLSDADPGLLVVFYRSLARPQTDGLIVADIRPKAELHRAFAQAGAFMAPATEYTVCKSLLKHGGPKYSLHQGAICSGGGWERLDHGVFRAYAKPRAGMHPVTFCDNTKYWTQRVVRGTQCEKKWEGLMWERGGTFWIPRGKEYCVGTRRSRKEESTFSRVLAQADCGNADNFKHDFNFAGVAEQHSLTAATVCVGRKDDGTFKVSSDDCQNGGLQLVARFAARNAPAAAVTDIVLCVEAALLGGDVIRRAGECGSGQKLQFAVPSAPPIPAPAGHERPGNGERLPVCIREGLIEAGKACSSAAAELRFEAPSLVDLAASTPGSGGAGPLYTLVEEEVPCFGFLCPSAWRALAS